MKSTHFLLIQALSFINQKLFKMNTIITNDKYTLFYKIVARIFSTFG